VILPHFCSLLQGGTTDNLFGRVLQEGMKLIVQEMFEVEATDFLKRGHYEHSGGKDFRGYRNWYEPKLIRANTRWRRIVMDEMELGSCTCVIPSLLFFTGKKDLTAIS
jgi:hypothetical protein